MKGPLRFMKGSLGEVVEVARKKKKNKKMIRKKKKDILKLDKKTAAKRFAIALRENGWRLTTPASPPYMNAEKGEYDVSIFFQNNKYKIIVGKGEKILTRRTFKTYNGAIGFIERLKSPHVKHNSRNNRKKTTKRKTTKKTSSKTKKSVSGIRGVLTRTT